VHGGWDHAACSESTPDTLGAGLAPDTRSRTVSAFKGRLDESPKRLAEVAFLVLLSSLPRAPPGRGGSGEPSAEICALPDGGSFDTPGLAHGSLLLRQSQHRSAVLVVTTHHHQPPPRTQLTRSNCRGSVGLRRNRTCRFGRSALATTHRSEPVAAARPCRLRATDLLPRPRSIDPKANPTVSGNTFRIELMTTPRSNHAPRHINLTAGFIQNTRKHPV